MCLLMIKINSLYVYRLFHCLKAAMGCEFWKKARKYLKEINWVVFLDHFQLIFSRLIYRVYFFLSYTDTNLRKIEKKMIPLTDSNFGPQNSSN